MKSAIPNEVLSHWHQAVSGFQTSTQEFYAAVERALEPHKLPGLTFSRIAWKEGGAFSMHREYLRVSREKLHYDICAAPFGADYFFSSWLAEIPPKWGLLKLALTLFGMLIVFGIFFNVLSAIFGGGFSDGAAFPVAVIVWIAVMWGIGTAVSRGSFGSGAEEIVIGTPVIGWLYVKLFGPSTYYRTDTTLAFKAAVHAAVLEVVQQVTAAKGIHLPLDLAPKPVMTAFQGR